MVIPQNKRQMTGTLHCSTGYWGLVRAIERISNLNSSSYKKNSLPLTSWNIRGTERTDKQYLENQTHPLFRVSLIFHVYYGFLLLIKKPVPILQYFYTDPAIMEKKNTKSSLACSRVESTIFRTIAHGDLPTSIKSATGHKLHSPKKMVSESYGNCKQAMDVYLKKLTPSQGIIGSLNFWFSIAVLWVM